MKSSVAPTFLYMTENISFQQVNGPLTFELVSTADGELLAFKNAVLARAEVNANRDEIEPDGIKELAASMVGRPIDIEHDTGKNCGAFTAARAADDGRTLSVDGFIWADRWPNEAEGVRNGTHSLSVEARADKALCSICNTDFVSADEYCTHLRNRNLYGSVRKLRGLHGKGGAVTTRPAGTNTGFSPEQIYFVASHNEMNASWYDKYLKEKGETLKDLPNSDFADPAGRRFPYKIHGEVKEEGWRAAWSAANGGHTGKKDEGAIAKLRRDKPKGIDIKESEEEPMADEQPKIEAEGAAPAPNEEEGCNNPARAEDVSKPAETEEENEAEESFKKFSAELASMAENMAKLQSSVEQVTARVAELTAARESDKLSARRVALKPWLTDAEWKLQETTVKAMDDSAFNLYQASLSAKPLSFVNTVRLPEPVMDGTREPLTLRSK